MKTKNIIKILFILVLAIIMLTSCTTIVQARPAPEDSIKLSSSSGVGINPDDYKPSDLTASDYYTPFKFAGRILTSITTVGIVISIAMVMVLGMKYMLGSVEEKAEYKKSMIPMLVGAILLFTSSTVVATIYGIIVKFN